MKLARIILLVVLLPGIANAQKLPNIQQVSLRSPAKIKIDGNATEWGQQLNAYNPATELSYTISNDNNNLYIVVCADKPRIVEKIIAVGITFTVNKNASKDYKSTENTVVTFPLLDVDRGYRIISAAGIKTLNVPPSVMMSGASKEIPTAVQADSLKIVANKLLKNQSKTIQIKGITGLSDTISIYNENNINVAVNLDTTGVYTYELSIPLKTLGLSINQAKPFSYSIKLRSRLEDKKKGVGTVYKYDKDGNSYNPNMDLDATTDFWSEYTLAK